jgi:hypothetical protein
MSFLALPCETQVGYGAAMMFERIFLGFRFLAVGTLLLLLTPSILVAEQPSAEAAAAFDAYIGRVEARLAGQHQSAQNFLAPADEARLRRGELVIERLSAASGTELNGALLHDWRGTAFVPGAKAGDFERLIRDFAGYPRHYAPQVLTAKILSGQGDHVQATMRVRQKHVLTVVMDTDYDVTFARGSCGASRCGYSTSRSTRVAEIDAAGTAHERVLSPKEAHGFLWRLNTYWSYQERDGGLVIQIESVSLTRAIPTGLGWAVGPFIESIPRESLQFTLGATRDALKK